MNAKPQIIVVAFVVIFVACSSSKAVHDDDTVVPDGDIPTVDNAVEAETDDFIFSEADEILPDTDIDTIDPDCPPLSTAPFPYYKEDGTIHFCRKCDTPTAKDPQCVTNLWKEANLNLATDHPEADCYPYPCEMSNLKPMTKEEVEAVYTTYSMHECDLMLGEYGWVNDDTGGQIKHWNLSGGKVGFVMYKVQVDPVEYLTKRKYFIYDVATKRYTAISPGDYGFAYCQGEALLYFKDARTYEGSGTHYIGHFESNGTYRVVYNEPALYIIYTPALNDKWVFANIQEVQNGPTKMMYAKIGEWKWTNLGEGVAYYTDLHGDLLAFYDNNIKGYVCDLNKSPKSLSDCTVVNRDTEQVRNIQFDRDHQGIFYYSRDFNQAITRVDMAEGAGKWVYEDVITDFSDATKGVAYSLVVQQVKNNTILYLEIEDFNGTEGGGLACFYRIDTKKRYCMKKMENDPQYGEWVDFPYGHSEFEGDWFLYQKHANSPLILRDMACYCEKEGICPFEGMK